MCQAENIGFEYDHRGLQKLILFYLILFDLGPLEFNMQIYAPSANWSMSRLMEKIRVTPLSPESYFPYLGSPICLPKGELRSKFQERRELWGSIPTRLDELRTK